MELPSLTPSAKYCTHPNASLGLGYWLGLRMFAEGSICSICHGAADPYGDHHVGCGGNGDRIFRHNSIRDAIFSVAQSAALAPRKEAPSLIPSSRSRPADIYLPNWKRGQPAALDVTVISTMQQLTQAGAASTPGSALHVGEERKMAAHTEACRSICRGSLCSDSSGDFGWIERGSHRHHQKHRPPPRSTPRHPSP